MTENGLREINGVPSNTRNIVLLSIKPKWFELIKGGKKRIEVRRKLCEIDESDELYFYVSLPIKKIMGRTVGHVEKINVENVTNEQLEQACLTRKEFENYINGCQFVYLLHLSLMDFEGKELLLEDFGFTRPPQNYCYIRRYNFYEFRE